MPASGSTSRFCIDGVCCIAPAPGLLPVRSRRGRQGCAAVLGGLEPQRHHALRRRPVLQRSSTCTNARDKRRLRRRRSAEQLLRGQTCCISACTAPGCRVPGQKGACQPAGRLPGLNSSPVCSSQRISRSRAPVRRAAANRLACAAGRVLHHSWTASAASTHAPPPATCNGDTPGTAPIGGFRGSACRQPVLRRPPRDGQSQTARSVGDGGAAPATIDGTCARTAGDCRTCANSTGPAVRGRWDGSAAECKGDGLRWKSAAGGACRPRGLSAAVRLPDRAHSRGNVQRHRDRGGVTMPCGGGSAATPTNGWRNAGRTARPIQCALDFYCQSMNDGGAGGTGMQSTCPAVSTTATPASAIHSAIEDLQQVSAAHQLRQVQGCNTPGSVGTPKPGRHRSERDCIDTPAQAASAAACVTVTPVPVPWRATCGLCKSATAPASAA